MTSSKPTGPSFPIEAIASFPPPGMDMPNSFAFAQDGKGIMFLHRSPDDPVQKLYMVDLQTGERRLLAAPPGGGVKEDALTPEEELRRQRERMLAVGITHYSRQGKLILVPLAGSIYVLDPGATELRLVVDSKEISPALTPKLSPDGDWIAFVRDAEVLVVPVFGGEAQQVTSGSQETGKTNGLAEYIAQEELGRRDGFWWSPDSSHIAYAEVDETHIPIYRIMHQGKDVTGEGAQEDHRYPFAGAENAEVQLFVISRDGGEPIRMDLNVGYEIYLARVFWWPDGALGAHILNRPQNVMDVVRFDPSSGERQTVLRETNDYWVNARTTYFRALKSGEFLWASERSGYNHLYLYSNDGDLIRQLTSGTWVVDDIESIDEAAGVVYFTGNRAHPTERHLYSAPLAGGEVAQITATKGMHTVTIDPKGQCFVDVAHSLENAPEVTIRQLGDNALVHGVHQTRDKRVADFDLASPELVSLENNQGDTLYGALYRPPATFGDGPFPTIVHVYGGPGPQLVSNSWTLTSSLLLQYLRNQGFLVFRLDNRGSARRGIAFEGALKHRMGTVEFEDQVVGVRWLIDQGLAKPDQIGVHGWSYGGYMSLMCMAKAPELFKVAVAGAPVTDWDGYDTAYTERYMGTPQKNPDGYKEGSVLSHVDGIVGKLLLIHGMIDENVHFRHTARLMNALNRTRKQYDLLMLPDERHLPRQPKDRVYLYERIVQYFEDHLKP